MISTTTRISIFVITFILVVVLPWWLSTLLLFGLTVYISNYIEVVFFGFFLDSLYLVNYNFPFTGLTIATVVLLLTMFVKTQVKDFS